MTLHQIRPLFQSLLRPMMSQLYKRHVTVNYVALTALVLSPFTGLLLVLVTQPILFLLLPIVFFTRMTLDVLGGMLAHEYNQKTHPGAILNKTGDVISDITPYLPFSFLPENNAPLIVPILFYTISAEFYGLLARTINDIRSYAGPLGKSDRALIFGLWGLAVITCSQWMQWNNLLWDIASTLLLWTATNHCRSVLFTSTKE